MHCTSPGQLVFSTTKMPSNGDRMAKPFNNPDSSSDCLYDDPTMETTTTEEWSPVNRPSVNRPIMPRSRSWFCCSQATAGAAAAGRTTTGRAALIEKSFDDNYLGRQMPCEYTFLVTEAPKPQLSHLHMAALTALNTEVLELKKCLQKSEGDKEHMKFQLKDAYEERERAQRRLESIGAAHESRLTEMHCVIVELNRKLKSQQENAILEEQEPDGSVSELSFQEGSVYNSDMEATNQEHRGDTDVEDTTAEPYQKPQQPCDDIPNFKFKSASPCTLPPPGFSTQMQALQEEIFHLRAQVSLLQSQLASCSREDEQLLNAGCGQFGADIIYDDEDEEEEEGDDEKSNHTSDDLCETADIFEITNMNEKREITKDLTNDGLVAGEGEQVEEEAVDFLKQSKAQCKRTINVNLPTTKGSTPKTHSQAQQQQQKSSNSEQPVTKMAERVKLRRTIEDMRVNDSNFLTTGIHSTEVAEHLVSDLLYSSESAATTIPTLTTNSSADMVQQLQKEVQRQQRRIEHLRLQNSVLNLTLNETKQHCNLLYLLCGKYESNAIALQQALNCSDRSIEAYDVMLALLESKLGLMELAPSAQESRKAAESVARHLLNRLECESNLDDNSLGPWQNAIVINPNAETEKWIEEDDNSLRNHVSKLKGLRSSIQNTVVILESPFSVDDSQNEEITSTNKSRSKHGRRMDLESAVLMQELMSMREDVSELKYAKEQAEREKTMAQQKLVALKEALVHLQAQLAESEVLLSLAAKDRTSFSEAEHTAGIERELVEALARESRLKGRLQALAGSLEAAARSSEERHTQVQTTVAELKTTNLNLNQSLERCKRKYQTRLRRLEQQLLGMSISTNQTVTTSTATMATTSQQHNITINDNVPETTL